MNLSLFPRKAPISIRTQSCSSHTVPLFRLTKACSLYFWSKFWGSNSDREMSTRIYENKKFVAVSSVHSACGRLLRRVTDKASALKERVLRMPSCFIRQGFRACDETLIQQSVKGQNREWGKFLLSETAMEQRESSERWSWRMQEFNKSYHHWRVIE